MHHHVRRAAILALAAGAALACTPAANPSGPGDANGGLANTSWTVISINGAATIPDARPTLTFSEDGTVGGSGGCNQYSGPFRTDGDRITLGELASTLMGCDGGRSTQEAAFMSALDGATAWRETAEGNLVLTGAGEIVAGAGIAEGPPPPAPGAGLAGTAWDLVEMGGTADFARIVPTIEFGADGSVSGFAACNTFSGRFTTEGDQLTLGPLASTKIGCERPASAVESAYLGALTGVTTWAIEGDGRLLLGGQVALRFAPR